MDLIKTGLGLTKTIRNVARLREIATVFAKHGFDEFISLGVSSKMPGFVLPKSQLRIKEELESKLENDWQGAIGYRLRLVFQDLGPAFIKFGQLLSSREDIFEQSFINEMKILRDNVKPIPFSEIREKVESDLGKKIEDVFREVDEQPIGTASIGVVFRAILIDGRDVVLKVKRPNIEKMIQTDFRILTFLIEQIEKVSEEVKFLGVSRIIHDFGLSLQNELNFNTEALNCERLKKNLKNHDENNIFYLPEIYKEYTTEDILVMERLKGVPFSNEKAIAPNLEVLKPKLEEGVKLFLKTFLKDGYFHADLHGGNFFYLDNGQIGIIDFGLMGSLGKKGRKSFIAIIYSLITFNYENLVFEFLDVAEYENIPDVDTLIIDVRDALSPYIGLTVSQIDFSILLQTIMKTLKNHQIYLPRDWYIVFRALMTLDGAGKSIGFDVDIYGLMEEDIQDIIKTTLNKEELIEEAIWSARDLLSVTRLIPRHIKWFTRTWAKNGYSFDLNIKGHEKPLKDVTSSIIFLSFSLLTSIFITSGVLVLGGEPIDHWQKIPTLSWIFWSLASLAFFRGFSVIRKLK
jgi:ubiquinone biosynthesis protein